MPWNSLTSRALITQRRILKSRIRGATPTQPAFHRDCRIRTGIWTSSPKGSTSRPCSCDPELRMFLHLHNVRKLRRRRWEKKKKKRLWRRKEKHLMWLKMLEVSAIRSFREKAGLEYLLYSTCLLLSINNFSFLNLYFSYIEPQKCFIQTSNENKNKNFDNNVNIVYVWEIFRIPIWTDRLRDILELLSTVLTSLAADSKCGHLFYNSVDNWTIK